MCTYPIGLVTGLLFRLEPCIQIASFELNVSPIAPPSIILMKQRLNMILGVAGDSSQAWDGNGLSHG